MPTATAQRKVKQTNEKSYLLEKAPRRLLEDAQTKCRNEDPPTTLKAKIIGLLREWTYG